jgi:hypothetical protein
MTGPDATGSPDPPPPPPTDPWLDRLLVLRDRRIAAIKALQEVRNSFVFVFWNIDELMFEDFSVLADALEDEDPAIDLDLVLLSPGGSGEAGYRIGHAFQQWAKRRKLSFRVIIPLYAKSAATILALGATELVMGLHSEIGPIDPQIQKYDRVRERMRYIPAMALEDGLKLIAEFIGKIPAMGTVFQEIVASEHLNLDDFGMLERARESGKQYGETLLTGSMITDPTQARITVERLSDYYKFHGHPIDAFEAEQELKLKVVHSSGNEWRLIKDVRDHYQEFVGVPGLVPGAVVTSVVETAFVRRWRIAPLGERNPPAQPRYPGERGAAEVR